VTDQLSLALDPALPRLPSLRPMLARPLPEPFDSDLHLFEPVWGGARALALIGPASTPGAGAVRMVAEDGTEGPAPIDLAGLAARIDARSAVIDGEIVVVDDAGRLDRDAMRARLAGEPGRAMSYLAFDLLDLDGRSLLRLGLDRRRALLRQVLRPGDEAVAVPAIASEGRALFEAVSGQGLYGIRARQRSSPYLPGVRSRLWRMIAVGESAARRGADAGSEGVPDGVDELGMPGRAQHVLALIRRLPLEFEEQTERPIEPAG